MDASLIIGIVALTVSLIVGVAQLIVQRRMTKIEVARHAEEVTSRLVAEVTARFESYPRYTTIQAKGYKFVLENLGPARAEDVSFKVQPPTDGDAPYVERRGPQLPNLTLSAPALQDALRSPGGHRTLGRCSRYLERRHWVKDPDVDAHGVLGGSPSA